MAPLPSRPCPSTRTCCQVQPVTPADPVLTPFSHPPCQALSIRPDLLSPAAMNELQKLCDKVPSFDNKLAMQVGI